MATPIKITPPLTGKQSDTFKKKLAETASKKMNLEEKEKLYSIYNTIISKQSRKIS